MHDPMIRTARWVILAGLAVLGLVLATPIPPSANPPDVPALGATAPDSSLDCRGPVKARVSPSFEIPQIVSSKAGVIEVASDGSRARDLRIAPESESAFEVARSTSQPIEVRMAAVQALFESRDDSVGTALACLAAAGDSPDLQIAALVALERRGDSRAANVATDLLTASPSARMRAEAAISLVAALPENADIVRLLEEAALSDPDRDVRIASIEALASGLDRAALQRISLRAVTDLEREIAIECLAELASYES